MKREMSDEMDIICIGLLMCDIIVKPVTEKALSLDATPVDTIQMLPGGDACNVACNAAALGMETALVSVVGDDPNGAFLRRWLDERHIDIRSLAVRGGQTTGTSIALIEPNGERHFLTNTEIFDTLYAEQVPEEWLRQARLLSLNGHYRLKNLDDGGIVPLFQKARQYGVRTVVDTVWNRKGEWLPRIAPTLRHTDIFLPSYQEAVQITGETDVRAMRNVLKPFGLSVFGVKLGEKGCYMTDFKEEFFLPAFPVESIASTTGAGDSFVAGFEAAQLLSLDLYESALFASAAASYTIQAPGAVGGVPDVESVRQYIRKNRHLVENIAQ